MLKLFYLIFRNAFSIKRMAKYRITIFEFEDGSYLYGLTTDEFRKHSFKS